MNKFLYHVISLGIEALNLIAEINGKHERHKIPEEAIFVEDPTNYDVTVNPKTGEI